PTEVVLETLLGALLAVVAAEAGARGFAREYRRAHAERAAAHRLASAYQAYRDLAEKAPDLIYTHDLTGRITYANEAFARAYGVSPDDMIGRAADDLVPRDPGNPDAAALRARLAAGEVVPPQIYWVKGPNGRRWLECVTSAIRD